MHLTIDVSDLAYLRDYLFRLISLTGFTMIVWLFPELFIDASHVFLDRSYDILGVSQYVWIICIICRTRTIPINRVNNPKINRTQQKIVG